VLACADDGNTLPYGPWRLVEKAVHVPMAQLDLVPVSQRDNIRVRT